MLSPDLERREIYGVLEYLWRYSMRQFPLTQPAINMIRIKIYRKTRIAVLYHTYSGMLLSVQSRKDLSASSISKKRSILLGNAIF